MTLPVSYSLFVYCCMHPDNEYDWIEGCVWASYWRSDSPHRGSVMMISQMVPLAPGEPARYIDDYDDSGQSVHERELRLGVQGDPHEQSLVRERVRERCEGCGRTLTMRDDTWRVLSDRLQDFPGIWRPMPELASADDAEYLMADLSLPVMQRLAEEVRQRTKRV